MKTIQVLGGPLDGAEFEVSDDASEMLVLGSDGTALIIGICDNNHAHWVEG